MEPYNPLDKRHLGESVAEALLESPAGPLPPEEFNGAGVYAIYYGGGFSPYQKIAERNKDSKFNAPIYVGKAVPPGARKGGYGLGGSPGNVLHRRLKEHADTIDEVKNLDLRDFSCRYLVVEDIWIPLGEALLIEWFAPLWNVVIDGFGNHDPGKGRYNQERSAWDVVHPGRLWANRCAPNRKSNEQMLALVERALSSAEP